jgi:hypothetical protein
MPVDVYTTEECMPPTASSVPGLVAGIGVSQNLSNAKVPADAPRGANFVVPPVQNWAKAISQAQAPADDMTDSAGRPSTTRGTMATPHTPNGAASTRSVAAEVPRSAGAEEPGQYQGTYLQGKKHGNGKLRLASGEYQGDFAFDQKHGVGVLLWDDGRRYEGEFRSGLFHGVGSMTWPDGRTYYGNYVEDRKHGQGVFNWPDGRCYDGQWSSGKRHGIGTYTNAKGGTRVGVWDADRPLRWELDNSNSARSHTSEADSVPRIAGEALSEATPRSFV